MLFIILVSRWELRWNINRVKKWKRTLSDSTEMISIYLTQQIDYNSLSILQQGGSNALWLNWLSEEILIFAIILSNCAFHYAISQRLHLSLNVSSRQKASIFWVFGIQFIRNLDCLLQPENLILMPKSLTRMTFVLLTEPSHMSERT